MESGEYVQSLSASLFWDVDQQSVDTEKHQRFLICRVMDRGTREDVKKTFAFYSEAVVLKNLQQARSLDRKTLHYFALRYDLPFESFRGLGNPEKRELDFMKLHRDAVDDALWDLLILLMQDEVLKEFSLVGDTALALCFGHRRSVDIDLFHPDSFDASALAEHLKTRYGGQQVAVLKNTVRCVVNGVKVECISHQYPLIAPLENIEGVRMLSLCDLAALKGNALANRGAKKDFWDIHRLLKEFPFEEILEFCVKKYQADSMWNVEKSFLYFEDAEGDPDPLDFQGVKLEAT